MDVRMKIGAIVVAVASVGIGFVTNQASGAPHGSDVIEGTLSIAMADSFTSQRTSSPLFFVDPGRGRPLVQLEARPAQQLELRRVAYRRGGGRGGRGGGRGRAPAGTATR